MTPAEVIALIGLVLGIAEAPVVVIGALLLREVAGIKKELHAIDIRVYGVEQRRSQCHQA